MRSESKGVERKLDSDPAGGGRFSSSSNIASESVCADTEAKPCDLRASEMCVTSFMSERKNSAELQQPHSETFLNIT